MEIIFKDIPIEKVTCWCYTPYITGLYFAMAEKRGVDLKAARWHHSGHGYLRSDTG